MRLVLPTLSTICVFARVGGNPPPESDRVLRGNLFADRPVDTPRESGTTTMVVALNDDVEGGARGSEKPKMKGKASHTVSNPRWGLDRIDQCVGRDQRPYEQMDADGVMVFIIDTGVQGSHPLLSPYISNSDCHTDFTSENEDPLNDAFGHGTHVAGTACGDTFGVATNCEICSVKVLDGNAQGSWADVKNGITWAARHCPEGRRCVANLSITSPASLAVLEEDVKHAIGKGLLLVVAAGHRGDACHTDPGAHPDILTVGSITQSNDQRSSWSSAGPCVDVDAPGTDIMSTWPPDGNIALSGTDMASPHVAGLAAGIWAANPTLSAREVKDKIIDDARLTGVIDEGGSEVRVANSVGDCNGPPPTPPPTPRPVAGAPCSSFRTRRECLQNRLLRCYWSNNKCRQ